MEIVIAFVHTHLHTVYSLLDGYSKIKDIVAKAKEYNMPAVAITDHGSLAGIYEFSNTCNKEGIKPLIGCEIYYTHDIEEIVKSKDERNALAWKRFLEFTDTTEDDYKGVGKKAKIELAKDFQYDTKGYHLVLIAKNQTGLDNLIRLTSEANDTAMFNGRGHADYDLIDKYKEGLICTTACISSAVNHNIRTGNMEEAIDHIHKLKELFGDDLYLEIQPLMWEDQVRVNKAVISLSASLGVKLIASTDVHYTNYEDDYEHDILLCIGTGKTYNDPNRMKYDHEYWFRNEDEMWEGFNRSDYTEAEKMAIELALFNTGVLAGPGRGSGAGSLVLFLLDICKGIDPIEYDLLFFRFLTMDRTEFPDIDTDIARDDRQEFLDMLCEQYGHNNVTSVGTLTLMGVKNGVKDVMRVLDYPFAESNLVTTELDEIYAEPDLSFEKLDSFKEDDPEVYARYKALEAKYPEVFDLARKLNGSVRNMGVHAGGVVITPCAINDIFPTRTNDGRKVTVWEKNTTEHAGGVKYDFLGLKTISVIKKCLGLCQ